MICNLASILPLPASPLLKTRSEEHTSELQPPMHPVCRLLLEKKQPAGHYRPLRAPDAGAPAACDDRARRPAGQAGRAPPASRSWGPPCRVRLFLFFFNYPAPPEISTLSPPAPLRI